MSRMNLSILNLNKFVIFLIFLSTTTCALIPFCYITCKINSCGTDLSNGCTTCSPYFILSNISTCNFDTAQSLYKLSKKTADFTILPPTTANCTSSHTYYGDYTNLTVMNMTTVTPISDPHYQIELIAWILLADRWRNDDYVGFQLVGSGQIYKVYDKTFNTTIQRYCGDNSLTQTYARFSSVYSHNDTLSNIQFKALVQTSYNDAFWGIKDVLIVTKLCHTYCVACTGPNSNQCSKCKIGYFLSGSECGPTCLVGYGQIFNSQICVLCNNYCLNCYNTANNCSTCVNTFLGQQVYKIENQNRCQVLCPTGYFPFLTTKQCLLCSTHCVTLSITNFVDPNQQYSQFVFEFTQQMDFSASFNYANFVNLAVFNNSLSIGTDFIVSYSNIDSFKFKLTLTPRIGLKFRQTKFCATTKDHASTSLKNSLYLYQLDSSVYNKIDCLFWQSPKYSVFSLGQKDIFRGIYKINNQIEEWTTQKGNQQIMKSGLLNLFMPGAQIPATVLLHSPRIGQNIYEASRFWGSFVFFDVPPFQKNSNKTKYIFSKPSPQAIIESKTRTLQQNFQDHNRNLQSNSFITQWKFQRTGHTGFFVIDTYVQLILIAICWILFFISTKIYSKKYFKKLTNIKIKTYTMAFFNKIHEISFFYIILSAIIQIRNFQTNYLHVISIIIASMFLFYFLVYQLKIFYDMISYPWIKLHQKEYEYYVQNYSIFLAYIRFQEYKDKNGWNWRHFLRPYNYPTLNFMKRAIILLAVPIFYDYQLIPIIMLTIIQSLDILRFIFTLPYHSNIRNLFYFILQCLLLSYFICSLINQNAGLHLYDSLDQIADASYIQTYKNSGWVGMVLIFIYNILYVLISLSELILLIFTKNSLIQIMWKNRNQYYQDLYEHFQVYGTYYRLIKNYTDELVYNSSRKSTKSFKEFINRIHQAQPIVDLSQQNKSVYQSLIQRGDIFKQQFKVQEEDQHILHVKIQTFTIKQFNNIYYSNSFNDEFDIYSPMTPKNGDRLLSLSQTRSMTNYNRPQRKDPSTKSLINYPIKKQLDNPISLNYQIKYQIIPQLFKSSSNRINSKKRRKVYYPKKIKNIIQSDKLNPHFQKSLSSNLLSFAMPGTQQIKLITYLTINLNDYKQGQAIPLIRQNMHQQIQILKNNKRRQLQLEQVMHGFPVDWQVLQKLSSKSTIISI